MIDLTIPEWAYFFAFAQADGHLWQGSRNKGKFSIELALQDQPLLEEFKRMFVCNVGITFRKRDTNFSKGSQSCTLLICDQVVRRHLNEMGLPYGKKSTVVGLPCVPFAERDYFRGWVDADGSVGKTCQGYPFLSFSTKSPEIIEAFRKFAEGVVGTRRIVNPNTRDGMFSLAFFKEDAQVLAAVLYHPGDLALTRKAETAQDILQWARPAEMRKAYRKKTWTPAEDAVVASQSSDEAARILERTLASVRTRAWRLAGGGSL